MSEHMNEKSRIANLFFLQAPVRGQAFLFCLFLCGKPYPVLLLDVVGPVASRLVVLPACLAGDKLARRELLFDSGFFGRCVFSNCLFSIRLIGSGFILSFFVLLGLVKLS
jgi:hypothetical protein